MVRTDAAGVETWCGKWRVGGTQVKRKLGALIELDPCDRNVAIGAFVRAGQDPRLRSAPAQAQPRRPSPDHRWRVGRAAVARLWTQARAPVLRRACRREQGRRGRLQDPRSA